MALINGQNQARTAGEWFVLLQGFVADEAAALGIEPPTYSRQEALAIILRLIAQQLGEIDQIPVGVEEALDP